MLGVGIRAQSSVFLVSGFGSQVQHDQLVGVHHQMGSCMRCRVASSELRGSWFIGFESFGSCVEDLGLPRDATPRGQILQAVRRAGMRLGV